MEDIAAFGTFSVRIFTLAVVEGKGTQIVGYRLCAADGNIADGIRLIIVPDAKAVAEILIKVYFRIGDEDFRCHLKAFHPVQGETLDVFFMIRLLFMGKEIPASSVCLQAIRMKDGIVGRQVGEFLIRDVEFPTIPQRLPYLRKIACASTYLFGLDEVAQRPVFLKEDKVLNALQQIVGKRIKCQGFGVHDAIVHPVRRLYHYSEEFLDALTVGREHITGQIAYMSGHIQPSAT